MEDIKNTGVTILKTFIKNIRLNERYEPHMDIACTAKPEFMNDIILEQSRSLTVKIIGSMEEELLQIFYDCNLNIIEFLIAQRGNQYGIEIKIPDMAKVKFGKEIQSLINSIRQQAIYFFSSTAENAQDTVNQYS